MLLANVPHLRAMMGARYVVCGPTLSPTDADAQQILETEGYRLYENANPMGRLTLVHRVAGRMNVELRSAVFWIIRRVTSALPAP